MAGCTIGSKLTVVMVIFFMTGETRLGSGLQISKFARVDMALGTSQRRVFTNKIEWHFIMIKDRAMRINAIVTGHTVRAEGQEMFGGKSHIHLQMAITARVLVEWWSISVKMAVLTNERGSIRFGLMRCEFE